MSVTSPDPKPIRRAAAPSRWRQVWQEFSESRTAMVALVICAILLVAAIIGPWIAPQNPYDLAEISFFDSRLPPFSTSSCRSRPKLISKACPFL